MAHRHWRRQERKATKRQHRPKALYRTRRKKRIGLESSGELSAAESINRKHLFERREKKKKNRAARNL